MAAVTETVEENHGDTTDQLRPTSSDTLSDPDDIRDEVHMMVDFDADAELERFTMHEFLVAARPQPDDIPESPTINRLAEHAQTVGQQIVASRSFGIWRLGREVTSAILGWAWFWVVMLWVNLSTEREAEEEDVDEFQSETLNWWTVLTLFTAASLATVVAIANVGRLSVKSTNGALSIRQQRKARMLLTAFSLLVRRLRTCTR
jgi:hypothetical protein